MHRLWLIFAQTATIAVALLFVVSTFRPEWLPTRSAPGAVLQQLNDLVAQTSRRRMLATAAVVLLDRDKSEATIASAGHPPVMLSRGDDVIPIELFAPPLGVRLPFHITSRTMPFHTCVPRPNDAAVQALSIATSTVRNGAPSVRSRAFR